MKTYLKNWNLVRILRLVIGLAIVGQGIHAGHWLIVGLGAVFALMPLLNIGCGSTTGCTTRCNVSVPRSSHPLPIKPEISGERGK